MPATGLGPIQDVRGELEKSQVTPRVPGRERLANQEETGDRDECHLRSLGEILRGAQHKEAFQLQDSRESSVGKVAFEMRLEELGRCRREEAEEKAVAGSEG